MWQDCWSEDVSKRPRFEDIIISLRGLLESAASRHKLQKTLTGTALMHCTMPMYEQVLTAYSVMLRLAKLHLQHHWGILCCGTRHNLAACELHYISKAVLQK